MEKTKFHNTKNLYFPHKITQEMNEIMEYPLTIVEAPMGYGKTTAVRECLKNLNGDIKWQRIYDSLTHGFWEGFCNMVRELDVECANNLSQLGFPDDGVLLHEAVGIMEGIALSKTTILVIDDYHICECVESDAFIRYLIEHQIPNLKIVLIVRFIKFETLEELKLKGYLKYIAKETFEFDVKEIQAYYKLCGINLKVAQAEQLYRLTEGWISAIYLLLLNYLEAGSFSSTKNIYKLLESTLYSSFSQEVKNFLNVICFFDYFTLDQASYVWQKEDANKLLSEIMGKNALIRYDEKTKTYHIHSLFIKLLREKFQLLGDGEKKSIFQNMALWYRSKGDFFSALKYFYQNKDFDMLMEVLESDRGDYLFQNGKDLFIKFFEECPFEIREKHPVALLIYVINLFMINEFERFDNACNELAMVIEQSKSLDASNRKLLMGEFQVLLSIAKFNDVPQMLEHMEIANELLEQPIRFFDTKFGWTFGSPSVLYMFYRKPGCLIRELEDVKEVLPLYRKITSGHGSGGASVMEAEWYFNRGDFVNAEILAHKGYYEAIEHGQYDIMLSTLFLRMRIALLKGDTLFIYDTLDNMYEDMKQKKQYDHLHTIDLCKGYLLAFLEKQPQIASWIENGDFESSKLYYPSKAFLNIVYGRVLLVQKEYYKLLGIADLFIAAALVFPNALGEIYTRIYVAAAYEKIFRREDGIASLKIAMEMAFQDKLYIPFVENCDYIKPLLLLLREQDFFPEDINSILDIYQPYEAQIVLKSAETSDENKRELSQREMDIALLAAEGFTNKEIGEKLFISPNTVKTMLKRVFEKLNITSRAVLKHHFQVKNR